MLTIVVKVLSIIGIILLCLLCLLLLLVLLILFFPVTYRVKAQKGIESLSASVKIRWLLGLLRGDYRYPEPGRIVIRLLFFTIYDSGKENKKEKEERSPAKESNEIKGRQIPKDIKAEDVKAEDAAIDEKEAPSAEATQSSDSEAPKEEQKVPSGIKKLRFTITAICDKIKDILDNIEYYRNLLSEEETKELFLYAKMRLLKILKNIRPRKVKADIRFGTGSPDTTGYCIGVVGMVYPYLGKHIHITPDFEEAVLLGEIEVAGRITGFVLIVNALKLVLDKKLRRFLTKIKREDK